MSRPAALRWTQGKLSIGRFVPMLTGAECGAIIPSTDTSMEVSRSTSPNHNNSMTFLIGVSDAKSVLPPVGESSVIGNHVQAWDDHLQWRVGSELLVVRDGMIHECDGCDGVGVSLVRSDRLRSWKFQRTQRTRCV